jgi:hypothetical protein
VSVLNDDCTISVVSSKRYFSKQPERRRLAHSTRIQKGPCARRCHSNRTTVKRRSRALPSHPSVQIDEMVPLMQPIFCLLCLEPETLMSVTTRNQNLLLLDKDAVESLLSDDGGPGLRTTLILSSPSCRGVVRDRTISMFCGHGCAWALAGIAVVAGSCMHFRRSMWQQLSPSF